MGSKASPSNKFDYRELLKTYITHVGYEEGITFLAGDWYPSLVPTKEE